jgi:hypothetical protein
MDCTLWFCKDGILRAKLKDSSEMISVKFLQEQKNQNDMNFWFEWWDTITYFEEGLTIGKFLQCLEPWAEFWGAYTGKNITSYIRESKKEYVKNKEKDNYEPFDWIELIYSTKLKPKVLYDESENDEELMQDFEKWIKEPKTIALSGTWSMYSNYDLFGYTKGKDDRFSTEGMKMNHMFNVPLVLNQQNIVVIEDHAFKRYFGKEYNWLSKNQFGICEINRRDTKMKYLVSDYFHSMKDVVSGFFFWMHETPYERDDFIDKISNMIDELEKNGEFKKANEIIGNTLYQIGEGNEESIVDFSKFLDIDKPQENKQEQKEEIIKLNNNDEEIHILPDAFDDLMIQSAEEKEEWDSLVEKAKNYQGKKLVQEGEVEIAKPIENRINSVLVKGIDKKAVPKPTDFKKEIR